MSRKKGSGQAQVLQTQLADAQAEIAKLKEDLGKQKEQKSRGGPRPSLVQLQFSAKGITIQAECRMSKLTSKYLQMSRQITHRAGEVSVRKTVKCRFCNAFGDEKGLYTFAWRGVDGKEYFDEQIKHFETDEGKEIEVGEFPATKILEISEKDTIPLTSVDNWLPEPDKFYELWSFDAPRLWQFIKWLLDNDKAAVGHWSFGRGFKEYYAIVYPVRVDGGFTLMVKMAVMQFKFEHATNGKDLAAPVGEAKPAPTLRKPTSILQPLKAK